MDQWPVSIIGSWGRRRPRKPWRVKYDGPCARCGVTSVEGHGCRLGLVDKDNAPRRVSWLMSRWSTSPIDLAPPGPQLSGRTSGGSPKIEIGSSSDGAASVGLVSPCRLSDSQLEPGRSGPPERNWLPRRWRLCRASKFCTIDASRKLAATSTTWSSARPASSSSTPRITREWSRSETRARCSDRTIAFRRLARQHQAGGGNGLAGRAVRAAFQSAFIDPAARHHAGPVLRERRLARCLRPSSRSSRKAVRGRRKRRRGRV